MRAYLSVHDVMPHTLDRVRALLGGPLSRFPAGHVPLLVVPGREWNEADLAQLRDWQAAGHPLAGHGWMHRVERYGGWRHRVHAALISRDVAEHLALEAEGILDLMCRCHAWRRTVMMAMCARLASAALALAAPMPMLL